MRKCLTWGEGVLILQFWIVILFCFSREDIQTDYINWPNFLVQFIIEKHRSPYLNNFKLFNIGHRLIV